MLRARTLTTDERTTSRTRELLDEADAMIVVRTARRDNPDFEGDTLRTRKVRDIVAYLDVTAPPVGMHMQRGVISFASSVAHVTRWATEVDEDGEYLTTTWTTDGVLLDGEYVEAQAFGRAR